MHKYIVFSLAVKGLLLLLGALGVTNMQAAIFADVGVMVLAVLYATRALRTQDLNRERQQKLPAQATERPVPVCLLSKPGIKIAQPLWILQSGCPLMFFSVFEIDFYAANGHTGNLLQGLGSELVFANTLRTVPGWKNHDGNGGA